MPERYICPLLMSTCNVLTVLSAPPAERAQHGIAWHAVISKMQLHL